MRIECAKKRDSLIEAIHKAIAIMWCPLYNGHKRTEIFSKRHLIKVKKSKRHFNTKIMNEKEVEQLGQTGENAHAVSIAGLFGGDNYFIFVYRKTEKIASALYLITSLLSDSEPLKWHLRERINEVLRDVLNFYTTKNESDLNKIRVHTTSAISLIEVGEKGALISGMNAMILKTEFMLVLKTIHGENFGGKFALPSDFFDVGLTMETLRELKNGVGSGASLHKGHHKGHDMSFMIEKDSVALSKKDIGKKELDPNGRRSQIISILKLNKESSIKDISSKIHGCSEKTIQRDLLSMVEDGVLKKIGERRWSRYSMR